MSATRLTLKSLHWRRRRKIRRVVGEKRHPVVTMVSDVLKMPFAMRGVMIVVMRERDVRVALPAAGLGFRSSQLDSHLRIPLSIVEESRQRCFSGRTVMS